jgi:glycerol-3-phosphate dehydrogenase
VELVVDAPVEGVDPGPDGIAVRTPRRSFWARFVVNCAGVFSDQVARLAGIDDFRILPRKGEEYMLDKRLKGLVRRLIFPVPSPRTKGTLIIPTFDGTIMVGPTAEDTEDRYDVSTTDSGAGKVFDFVRQICPAISPRDTIAEFAGLRAVSDSNDFVIGPTRAKGFINVAGIQSPGLTASPAIAEYVREILREQGLALREKPDFRSHAPCAPRFSAADPGEQERLVAENPLFARVVCRCELVTEAEVVDAIDRGARTLDGIKFRTRAGMGRCQGGFCTSRCMHLLAERGGVPIHEITKRGPGSWIVAEMSNDQHPVARAADEKSC